MRIFGWIAVFSLTLIGLAACSSASVQNRVEPPTVLPSPVVFATKTPSATVAEIMISSQTSPYLDHVHLQRGVTCQACHDPFPPVAKPAITVCLSCHGGTYAAVAAKTQNIDPNPHASHRGEEPCTSCHVVHAPFVYMCAQAGCHTDWKYTGRFAKK